MIGKSIKNIISAFDEYNQCSGQDGILYKINESMKLHTTFKIGGFASVYAAPDSPEALTAVLDAIKSENVKYFILGRGSNVLFDDAGFDGIVVSTKNMSDIKYENGKILCMSGAVMSAVASCARDNNIGGMEFLYGIPGSIGGGVFMNAGAYGGEMSQILVSSTYINLSDLSVNTMTLSDHEFGYRKSVYKTHSNCVVLSAVLAGESDDKTSITLRMNDFMDRRRSKQPLEYPSAGSVFKRCSGHYTGQLIEEAGLKGFSVGGAQVSDKHAGFIVNKGGATCQDVLSLIEIIKSKIEEKYGLNLETEVILVK